MPGTLLRRSGLVVGLIVGATTWARRNTSGLHVATLHRSVALISCLFETVANKAHVKGCVQVDMVLFSLPCLLHRPYAEFMAAKRSTATALAEAVCRAGWGLASIATGPVAASSTWSWPTRAQPAAAQPFGASAAASLGLMEMLAGWQPVTTTCPSSLRLLKHSE